MTVDGADAQGGDGFDGQSIQHFLVHIGEFLDIEARLAGGVLPELRKQRLRAAEPGQIIKNDCSFARRKT
jgi:hypothetical protein